MTLIRQRCQLLGLRMLWVMFVLSGLYCNFRVFSTEEHVESHLDAYNKQVM